MMSYVFWHRCHTCVDVGPSDEPLFLPHYLHGLAEIVLATDPFARSWCLTWIPFQMDLVVGESTTEHIGPGDDGWL